MWPLIDVYLKILFLKKDAKDLPYARSLFIIPFVLTLLLELAFVTRSGGAPIGKAALVLLSASLVFLWVISALFKTSGYPERRVQIFSALCGTTLLLFSFSLLALRFLVLFQGSGALFFLGLNGWQLIVQTHILAQGLEIPVWRAACLVLFITLMKNSAALLVLRLY